MEKSRFRLEHDRFQINIRAHCECGVSLAVSGTQAPDGRWAYNVSSGKWQMDIWLNHEFIEPIAY